MASLFSSLNTGRLGLLAQQYTMNVLGNNVANVSTEGYTRRRVVLAPTTPTQVGQFVFGTGVKVEDIQRVRDTFLDIYLRNELGTFGELGRSNAAYKQIEVVFNELTGDGRSLSGMMAEFWNAWHELSTEPENTAMRQTVVSNGGSLAGTFRYVNDRLNGLRADLNTTIRTTVSGINDLAVEIQTLNNKIVEMENTPHEAHDLRDQRDLLLDQLSQLAGVTVRDLGGGEMAVFVNGNLLVSAGTVRTLETVVNADGLYDVCWADTGENVSLSSGELEGLLDARDTTIPAYVARLDALAAQIIKEVNRLHSQGNGLDRYTTATTGNAVDDADAALSAAAGLVFEDQIQTGSFWLAVYDANGALLDEQEISITAGASTLSTVAAEVNADFLAGGTLQTSVSNGQLTIELGAGAPAGASFSFVKSDGTGDTSNALMALGLNTFFAGEDSQTISIATEIEANPNLVATADSTAPGNNTIATAIANLRNQAFTIGTDASACTFGEYYEMTMSTLAVESSREGSLLTNQENVVNAFKQQREAYSGVNLDEELAHLIAVEHAYTASARYISTIDQMLDTLLSIA
ncbi:MAG: flagellar hook-associated protein FlgK [Verrucomicrobia bacterium]|nr:flagellar hook-associated protein FlgK [Verrucomicrobiota bacterium]